jgi:hypothetical protein
MTALVLAPSADPAGTADQAVSGPLPRPSGDANQTYCPKLVRSSRATPTDTAEAAPA